MISEHKPGKGNLWDGQAQAGPGAAGTDLGGESPISADQTTSAPAGPPAAGGAPAAAGDLLAALGHYSDTGAAPPAGGRGGGGPLPGDLQGQMGTAFGTDFSDVRVHQGGEARQLGARAFTRGTDMHFAPGQYDPSSRHGKELIGHELAHVVQQRRGTPALQQKSTTINHDTSLEREADAAGAAAATGGRVKVRGAAHGGVQCEGEYTPKDSDKVTVGKTMAMRDDWYDAAMSIILRVLPTAKEKGIDFEQLMSLLNICQKEKGKLPEGMKPEDPILDQEAMHKVFDPNLPRKLSVYLQKLLGAQMPEVVADLRDSYIRVINRKEWKTITRDVGQDSDGPVTSKLTPINQEFDETYHKDTGVKGKRWGESGLSSMSPRLSPETRDDKSETKRPTNFWHSELTTPQGEKIFEGFRSGAFTDASIQDPELRMKAGMAKARGVLEAMVIHKLKAIDPQERLNYTKGDQVLDGGNVLMIDLLSNAKDGLKGDKSQVEQHHQVISNLNNKEIAFSIKVGGQPVVVLAKFNLIDFNFGVNQASGRLFGSKGNQKDINGPSLERLEETVEKWEDARRKDISKLYDQQKEGEEDPLLDEQIEKALIKLDQVLNLFSAIKKGGASYSGGYKVPAMIANLGHLMGDLVHFNCKSGKDRTGMMDAASKNLARDLHKNRQGKDRTFDGISYEGKEEKRAFQEMLWEGGNLDVLKQNVGGQSLKVADMHWIPGSIDKKHKTNLGGSSGLKQLRWLNEYTNIDTITNPEGVSKLPPKKSKFKKEVSEELDEKIEERNESLRNNSNRPEEEEEEEDDQLLQKRRKRNAIAFKRPLVGRIGNRPHRDEMIFRVPPDMQRIDNPRDNNNNNNQPPQNEEERRDHRSASRTTRSSVLLERPRDLPRVDRRRNAPVLEQPPDLEQINDGQEGVDGGNEGPQIQNDAPNIQVPPVRNRGSRLVRPMNQPQQEGGDQINLGDAPHQHEDN